jgi:hypothetical protein
MKSVDRDRPIVTGIASFTPEEMERIANLETPHMGRGIEFGVGRTRKPISNFPGVQTVFRPMERSGQKRPKGSVDQVLESFRSIHEEISRVTLRIGTGTDSWALEDVLQGIKEIAGDRVETVVSSLNPDLLRKIQKGKITPDILQQTLHWADPFEVMALVRKILKNGDFVEDAEVSFPIPETFAETKEEVAEIAEILGDAGHDSHLAPVSTQKDVQQAIGVMGWSNFTANARGKTAKMRGFYADGQGLTSDVPGAQLLGF